jgi:hypothetical protein
VLEVNQQGHEADHSSASSAKVKNGGDIPPQRYLYLTIQTKEMRKVATGI